MTGDSGSEVLWRVSRFGSKGETHGAYENHG